MSKKVVIVGGVAGGASAAARLRRLDENAEIIMFEKGEYISFANCGLPYHIGETIKERGNLILQTPEEMGKKFNIDIRVESEVVEVDTKNTKVKVNSKDRGIYEENYDYLILSPGGRPLRPAIEGIDSKRILTLRNIPDMDKIKAYIDDEKIKRAVVIGGGYIGVEMAENLIHRGIHVSLVEAAPHILAPFDSDMVTYAEKELEDNGVALILNDGVKSFKDNDRGVSVTLNSGRNIDSEIVILAIGVKPDTDFIKDNSIELGNRGHILVKDNMETNIPNIYAVGDAVEVIDFISRKNTAIPLAGPANKQGRIAADNIYGINSKYKGTQGTAIIKVFDLTAASTGNNERSLKASNIDYKVVHIHPQSHASYYPGAIPMAIKVLFDKEGKILGAQGCGYDGVDKRIDVIATAIRLGGTIYDLEELELAYAPPYSSAKDPVNMAGFLGENILKNMVEMISTGELDNRDKENTILLDVRTELEYSSGNIKGSFNIPLQEIRSRLNGLDKSKEIIVYCQIGLRGYFAYRILKANGFRVKNLNGGYKTYTMSKFTPKGLEEIREKSSQKSEEENMDRVDKELDICGLSCPGPLMQVSKTIGFMEEGEILKARASDPGFFGDIRAWCERTNNELIDIKKEKGIIEATIKKGQGEAAITYEKTNNVTNDNKTIVVFSGDLDKAIASFIIANGAASMGKKVTMFFTFWGLNILRKPEKISVTKGFMDKMFGVMMPRGSKKLKLSNMNMMGMGPKMIRMVMKNKNITSLEELIKSAMDSGINIVACQMSMDVMGLKKEELIDGVEIGGVGYYLGEAEDSNVNLFI